MAGSTSRHVPGHDTDHYVGGDDGRDGDGGDDDDNGGGGDDDKNLPNGQEASQVSLPWKEKNVVKVGKAWFGLV